MLGKTVSTLKPFIMVKVHILFEFQQGPWGGGNQFLKSLKKYLYSINAYDENIETAQIILFNSHQCIGKVAKTKLKYPEKTFIHRIDGPIRLYSHMNDKRDSVVFAANKHLADATIFQSTWSQQQNHLLGLQSKAFETIIPNAPEPTIFNRNERKPFSTDRKSRLIAASWSPNWKKGFDVYQWLDENLDFSKYEMVFVGKSPVQFKNIEIISPLTSTDLAKKLKENDIFIFASPIEACSNSLLEALHCGLPTVGPNQSSSPEIIGRGGETFSKPAEIPDLLEKIKRNYHQYQTGISNPPIEDIGKRYYDFMMRANNSEEKTKSSALKSYIHIQTALLACKFFGQINKIKKHSEQR